MSKKLLISDVNIIIDFTVAGLTEAVFALQYDYGIVDLQFAAELEDQQPEILEAGLRLYELAPKSVAYASSLLIENARLRVSIYDCMALSLAKQEDCTLLTGDAKLRQLALMEGVTVRGTLWLMEQMLEECHITAEMAKEAYAKMLDDGSRLPEDEIQKQLERFRARK